jgi:recombination protein RecA
MQHLLATGQVRRASAVPRHQAPATWSLAELSGRVVELSGRGATALLTVAVGLVLEAQHKQEPVAWITHPAATVFPPDVTQNGIDLSALLFVRVEAAEAMLRAVDHLLRSGAFGLVILDLPAQVDVPLSAQVRLAGLVKKHAAALVYLVSSNGVSSNGVSSNGVSGKSGMVAASSLVSLRATCHRRRVDAGRFECALHVSKDKRRGQEWSHVQVFHGAVGLR